mgnify:CR=1 FL=1
MLDKAASSVSLELKNTGKSTLFARLVTEGILAEGKEKAYANGLTLAVSIWIMTVNPVNASTLQQGTNFTAVVTIANPSPRGYSHLVLTEVFPAGWRY